MHIFKRVTVAHVLPAVLVLILGYACVPNVHAVAFRRPVPVSAQTLTERPHGVRTAVVENIKRDFCPLCVQGVEEAYKVLPENQTVADLEAFLGKVCKILPSKDQGGCTKIVDEVSSALLMGGVTSIGAKYTPHNVCSMLEFCTIDCCDTPNQPEQVHLSLTNDPTEMVISWATLEPVVSQCQYSTELGVFNTTVNGTRHTYGKGGWNGWLHVVTLTGLTPGGTRYYYRCGDPTAQNLWRHRSWTVPTLSFRTAPASTAPMAMAPYKFAVVADMGATDASDPTIHHIGQLLANNELNMVLHIGDISYADTVQSLQDEFQRKIEHIAAEVPQMTNPGNHEGFFNFTPYQNRYTMPYKQSGSDDFLYYSFDYGPVHIVAINTEGYSGLMVGNIDPASAQYQWIAQDLAKVDRSKTPFVIVTGHRPFYCSSKRKECDMDAQLLRTDLEDLFVQYQVDLVLTGHVHAYERTFPVYKSEVAGTVEQPKAPIYIVCGASGSKEQLMDGFKPTPAWSAAHNGAVFGYGTISVSNTSALTWQYFDNDNNQVIDSFTLSKY
eukprot:TRINITY_DN3097_c0_g1_i1.p1 TRINITY_DN3097_c0_g1~~TRINITY_DN3097_c0_g1_i1.p1  ORF type:complete len:552 (-),score=110.00 TRINITY_DN3097_c0_g1_i1:7-1662(-)